MTTETKRDLVADLALCEAATEYVNVCDGEAEVFCDYIDPDLPNGSHVAQFVRTADALMFVEAREGWPHAIRRAMAAEAEVERLSNSITRLRDRLICDLDAIQSGDTTERSAAFEDCIESTLRRIDRYILSEVNDIANED